MYEQLTETLIIRIKKSDKENIKKALDVYNRKKPWYNQITKAEFIRETIIEKCNSLLNPDL